MNEMVTTIVVLSLALLPGMVCMVASETKWRYFQRRKMMSSVVKDCASCG